jgi:hypothetical protein
MLWINMGHPLVFTKQARFCQNTHMGSICHVMYPSKLYHTFDSQRGSQLPQLHKKHRHRSARVSWDGFGTFGVMWDPNVTTACIGERMTCAAPVALI